MTCTTDRPWSPDLYISLLGLVTQRVTSGIALICSVDLVALDLSENVVCLRLECPCVLWEP